MKKIAKYAYELIGNTPIVELSNIEKNENLTSKIFAKMEKFNFSGSVKDRVAKAMIEDAEKKGLLKKGYTVIEPTSGNTGIGLAAVCASKGYKIIIVMPDTMSIERRQVIKAYGAELVLTDGKLGMQGAVDKANELKQNIQNSFIPAQFSNMSNVNIHYETTAKEIWDDMDGKVDIFVAGVGTGGTITGVGKFLKEKNKNIKIIAVEPESSPVLSKGVAGAHKIQGIGAGFIPEILDTKIYDEVITIKNEEAFKRGAELAKIEGLLVGISSGAALEAAIQVAKREENKNKNIVVIFPDTGDRYLSTPMFESL